MMGQKDASDDAVASQRLIIDQREANAQMVGATIRAQEATEHAEAAQARAEAATNELRESEERYRVLFDSSPVAVYSCDAAGMIQNYNRHAAELWGREPALGDTDERICGSSKLFRPDGSFLPHEECPMAEVLSGKIAEARDAEVMIERPDGSRVTVLVNISPVRNQRGEVTAAINCFYDITGRKRAESQVANALIVERQLAEFREMFIGIVGHDLRSPVTAISLSATVLLQRGHLGDQDAETAARIIRSTQRINRMISQLLDLTRARLGDGLSIEPTPTDLREIFQDVMEEFGAAVQLDVKGDVTGTWGQDRLSQVLSNLVGNATAYALPNTDVIVKAWPDGPAVVIEVSNQGEPIPADLLPFIFEPFRGMHQRGRAAAGHLGLGLYIAHQIVLSHGGMLDAVSEDGTTTFITRLPRRPPSAR